MFYVAERFAQHHGGYDGIERLLELCNRGTSLEEIGREFRLSASQVCRLRSQLFRQTYVLDEGTRAYLEFAAKICETKRAGILRLITAQTAGDFETCGLARNPERGDRIGA
jgi:hypothetical protein